MKDARNPDRVAHSIRVADALKLVRLPLLPAAGVDFDVGDT